jgi:hypothetical protein
LLLADLKAINPSKLQNQRHFAASRPQGHQPKQIFPQFLHKKEDIQIFSSLMIVVLLI